jgi:hypothetical protein
LVVNHQQECSFPISKINNDIKPPNINNGDNEMNIPSGFSGNEGFSYFQSSAKDDNNINSLENLIHLIFNLK